MFPLPFILLSHNSSLHLPPFLVSFPFSLPLPLIDYYFFLIPRHRRRPSLTSNSEDRFLSRSQPFLDASHLYDRRGKPESASHTCRWEKLLQTWIHYLHPETSTRITPPTKFNISSASKLSQIFSIHYDVLFKIGPFTIGTFIKRIAAQSFLMNPSGFFRRLCDRLTVIFFHIYYLYFSILKKSRNARKQ